MISDEEFEVRMRLLWEKIDVQDAKIQLLSLIVDAVITDAGTDEYIQSVEAMNDLESIEKEIERYRSFKDIIR